MENLEKLKLENQLCFALYVCSKEIIKKYKPILSPIGLTYTSYITIMSLWEKDGISVKELGEKLYLDSGTLTPLLKKMEKDGFILRKRCKKDERTVIITLTKKGHDLKVRAADVPMKMSCAIFEEENQLDIDPQKLLSDLHKIMGIMN